MTTSLAAPITVSEQEAYTIGMEAYVYFYPIITMELTRKQCTNTEAGKRPGFGPANLFTHMRAYPEADFKTVVRPNFDTLYSVAWLDLRNEPVVISVPDTAGRYYVLEMLDMWTDAFAAPGWRTTGTKAMNFLVAPAHWQGQVPAKMVRIDAPTLYLWLIGRTKTDGPDDYANVHKIQDGFTITPLSSWGKAWKPEPVQVDSTVDMKTPPLEQINSMKAGEYFALASQLLNQHSPHLSDWSQVERLAKIGIKPGETFDIAKLDGNVAKGLERAVVDALKYLIANVNNVGRLVNGWRMNTDTMGVYGNSYVKRAIVCLVGLGANQPEDAVYPLCASDADGQPLNGDNNYVLHFAANELPPVSGFWSVTMYDKDGFQSTNALNRFAISSWMPLKKNADGSLDLYIQHENPGSDKEANWLPAPRGPLGVTMRLYGPDAVVLNGDWAPPAVKKVQG